jgi:ABC-type glycerol-3-phosphate transport system permease component
MASTTTTSPPVARDVPAVEAEALTPRPRLGMRINMFRVVVYLLLILGALLFVMPFLWMVSTSLQNLGDISRGRFVPSMELLSVTRVEEADLDRKLQDYLDAGERPAFLSDVRGQIETSTAKRDMSLRDYMRTQRTGFAELSLKIDLPLINKIWKVDSRYVVLGGMAHYIEAWDESNFSEFFVNSIQLAGLTIFAQLFTSILAAYAFARMEFPGRDLLFAIFLATIFIPTMVVLIPNRNTVTSIDEFFTEDFPQKQDDWGITDAREAIGDPIHDALDAIGIAGFLGIGSLFKVDGPIVWKWIDSWPALVFPFIASTFSIFLLRQFFLQIPDELWDAARIDGAGHFRFLFQVVVPISRAALMTVTIFTFITTWNALEWPILVTFTDEWRPISYGLYAFTTEAGRELNKLMAGSVITLVPVLVIYLIAQKQFTEGIATTGLKG